MPAAAFFIAQQAHKSVDQLHVTDLSAERTRQFLLELEQERHCSIATRNQRLAAFHSLANFIGLHSPEHLEWCRQIHTIPFKKTSHPVITYLEKSEMDALLAAPDCSTAQGLRDHALLLFLYNTGARADEVAQLTIAEITIAHVPQKNHSSVLFRGKGNKLRRCPLWPQTVKELMPLVQSVIQLNTFSLTAVSSLSPVLEFTRWWIAMLKEPLRKCHS